jgi:hypothetical protein
MRRLSLPALCILLLAASVASTSQAADHRDSPATAADSAADINDVYMFRSGETLNDRSVFVMTVFPDAPDSAMFSDAVEYRFNITDRDTGNDHSIICTADASATQMITCTKNGAPTTLFQAVSRNEVVTCSPGASRMCTFAGLRDDPFFFDAAAFTSVLSSCLAGACDPGPLVDADTDGTDSFAGTNVLSIVVDIQNAEFGTATNLAVWASTVRMGGN